MGGFEIDTLSIFRVNKYSEALQDLPGAAITHSTGQDSLVAMLLATTRTAVVSARLY